MSVFVRDIRRAMAQMIRNRALPGVLPEHVYTNRVRPLDTDRMPAICIFTTTEEADPDGSDDAPRTYQCVAEVAIAVYVRTTAQEDTDEDDKLDDYLQVLRNIFGEDDTMAEQAEGSTYVGCDWIQTAEGEFAMGAGILRYKVRYREEQPGPDRGDLDNLRRIHVDYDGAPKADGKIDAMDDVRFP